jgi:small-conductance mechanosensitive channel
MTIPGVRSYGTSILASAGVAGIVLGFAAQQTLANVLAGIQIAVTQPLRYDDAVVIDGEWGWVEETTLTYIVVRLWDRRRLVVPISQLLQRSFQNWTRSSSSIIGTVYLYLDYNADLEGIRAAQNDALAETHLWDGDVNVVQVIDTTETTMVVRSLVSAKDSPTTWDLRCYLRERLIRYLRGEQPEALPLRRLSLDTPESAPAIPRPGARPG